MPRALDHPEVPIMGAWGLLRDRIHVSTSREGRQLSPGTPGPLSHMFPLLCEEGRSAYIASMPGVFIERGLD